MKRKIALLDIDGSLLNWHKGFAKYMLEQGHELSMADEYDLLQHYPSVGCKDKMFEYVKAFNTSEGFGELEAEPYAKEFVQQLIDEGYELHWCSCYYPETGSVEDAFESQRLRVGNLKEVFGGLFSKVNGTTLPLGHSKVDILTQLAEISDELFFVDDSPKYIQEGLVLQKDFPHVKVAVWDQIYNQDVQADMRINTQYFLSED